MALLLVLSWVAGSTRAAPLKLADRAHGVRLAPQLEVLEDPAGTLGIADLQQAAEAGRFRAVPAAGAELNFGYSGSAFWLRLPFEVAPEAAGEWLLEVAFPSLDRVDVYLPRGGDVVSLSAGDLQPFSERPLPHRNLLFPLRMEAGAGQALYLRVMSGGSLTVPATLWTPEGLRQHDQQTYALLSLYYGMLLALMLYNLLLYLSIRDRAYLEYVCFVLSMAVGQASLNGFGNQFLWPEWTAWGNVALPSGMAATGFFGALFSRSFLGTKGKFPGLDRAIVTLALAFAVAAISPLFLSYRLAAILTSATGLVFAVVAVVGGVMCQLRGHPGARYFLLAWTLLLVGVALMSLRNMGWLPTTLLTTYAMQVGSALEMLLLSFALADRINVMRREKEAAQQEALAAKQGMVDGLQRAERGLEARVAERTAELATANLRLKESEQELRNMARRDPLTGLANRILLDDRLSHALVRARRSGCEVAVLLMDLDGFKPVNDAYGHAAGDQLLIAIARRLEGAVREGDTVARIGGDEFVVLIEDLRGREDADVVAAKLATAVSHPIALGARDLQVSASIGIAQFPDDASDAHELLERADRAMYAAKTAGRNTWRSAAQG